MAWRWNPVARRYQDSITGQFMTSDKAQSLVFASLDASSNRVAGLANLAANGQINPSTWRDEMREQIKREYIRQYGLGRGGLDNMTQADWGRIGGMLQEQYRYLDGFYDQLEGGAEIPEGVLARRSEMYINSAREAYERANGLAQGVPIDELPTYPGAGDTPCLTGCNCNWEYDPIYDINGEFIIGYECYWRLGASSEHCNGCIENAQNYSPLRIML